MMKHTELRAAAATVPTSRAAYVHLQSSRFNPKSLVVLILALALGSCGNERSQSHGPIVLGDSSNIVTETNPELLVDRVQDLNPVLSADGPLDTATTAPVAAPKDTVATIQPAQQPAQPATPPSALQGKGLSAAFSEVTVFIPNVETKTYGKQDLSKARGATYELTGGNLAGAQIRTSGGTVTKVTQRYQTVFAIPAGRQDLNLETLGAYTSGWETLRGSGGSFSISGLEANKLQYKNVSASAIRSAVEKSARQRRLSRRETQQLLADTKNIRSAAQGKVKLRSVSWRIEGKDARGRSFNKEIRIDVPLS